MTKITEFANWDHQLQYHQVDSTKLGYSDNFILGDYKSFGFPNDYENGFKYKYPVIAPAGKVIKLTWVEFEIELAGYSGCYDYVKVTDSDGAILMDETCNKELPDPVEYISKTNKIFIEHYADGASKEKGYHFRWTSEDPPSGRRKRQAISLVKERELECVEWLGGTGGYWKYDKTIPKACYSKQPLPSLSLSSGVNCTKADLPDIETDRTDVKYGSWYIENEKQTGVWDGSASVYDIRIK